MDDRKDNAIATGRVGEACHGPGAPADFPEHSLNRVRGPHAPPIAVRDGEEGEEGVPVAQERGDGHGRGGLPDVNPTLERAFGRWSRARLIDAARHVEAGGAIAETDPVGYVAEDMDPTRLAGDLGIDVVKSGMEPTMAVGGDKAELAADEPAGGEGEEKGFPAAVTFAGHEPEVEEFTRPSARRLYAARATRRRVPSGVRVRRLTASRKR